MDIKAIEKILEADGIVFLTYGGFITQSLIAGMTDALERESEKKDINQRLANNIFVIFIELSQNMMNYSKSRESAGEAFDPKGLIVVGKGESDSYYILSQNILDRSDRDKIQPKLEEIQRLDNEALKLRYRELRKSGRDSHGKGAGIGFYEIAKRCDRIQYEFIPIGDDKYYFQFKAIVK
ncbi:SiaB family protein kinase [Marinobacterium sp. D7]|uniref:SiaB family protein kinase n=1 Tax=Marinobacterium ramblicola TaxID=2849041 RepID=UPI001C2D2167|nr:SiaB family protein kinase [Marinobacterium ramblicola]MBV1786843.1 SiaB family protein kinase [Marinobacterium ramblicola]